MNTSTPSSSLIPYDAVESICDSYAAVSSAYCAYFDALETAHDALANAEAGALAIGCPITGTHLDAHQPELAEFARAVRPPKDVARLRITARRLLKMRYWQAVIDRTELRTLMDRQALDDLRAQMAYVPVGGRVKDGQLVSPTDLAQELPEVTPENVEAMLQGFLADAGTIWRRGLANAFAELDRAFRSHDGFKVGRRVVLPRAFNDHGSWCYYDRVDEKIRDVERALLLLDGKRPRDDYAGVLGAINAERKRLREESRRWTLANPPGEVETEYFTVRFYQNSNVHLWFTRDDLLARVNEELAEYYGARVGWGRYEDDAEPDPGAPFTSAHERTLAKRFGEFFSPPAVVEEVLRHARAYSTKPLRILEPSAGAGNLSSQLVTCKEACVKHLVDVVEIQAQWASELRASGLYATVYHRDFLSMPPCPIYDRVVMNPPFDRWRDCDHVHHALRFLASGGTLVSVVSASTAVGESPKAVALRREVEQLGGRFYDLPYGSFREAGTEVNTAILVVSARA